MSDTLDLEKRIEALERENHLLFRWGWITVMVLNVLAAVKVIGIFQIAMPRFETMFVEMLAGEPLPLVTRLCISFSIVPVVLAVFLITAMFICGLLGKKRFLVPVVGGGILCWILLMVMASIGTYAQFAPLFRLIERLG